MPNFHKPERLDNIDAVTVNRNEGLGFTMVSQQERLNNTARRTEQTYIAIDEHFDDTKPVHDLDLSSTVDTTINANEYGTVGLNLTSLLEKGHSNVYGELKVNPYLRGVEMEIGYERGKDKISGSLFANDVCSGAQVQYSHTFNENESIRATISNERASVGYKKNNVGVIAHSSFNKNEYFGVSAVIRF
ncbi:MAG: hypothetical protein NC408_09035 [Candidatus Gastranaerophilales bacterium]|nr:hypothetical protein [Candidatus Gastranaerophilales bacterium]MCM1072453.1 hypothetical protein [Bacteroides sp.]